MRAASHAVCFEWPGEPGCGGVLSTGVYGCSWFSFGFAVSFAVRVFLLAAHWCFVWTSNGKLFDDSVLEVRRKKHRNLT